ncbi:MAG: protein-L-isoaspartate(D-aspartate) O-methyltransferase [Planctomycetia bacterium]|nr:protein-L-isoaspartate(D-aspartate) O-methyltransferase [Planctomycetia bacterium]
MVRHILFLTTLSVLLYSGDPTLAQYPKSRKKVDYEALRESVCAAEMGPGGITNERVIESMRTTPRHEFMPQNQRHLAYYDMGVAIGWGQTISSIVTVASMTQWIDPQPEDRVLEIGTGSGYQAAVLSPLVKEVYTIEIVEPLGKRAASTLRRLKYGNVFCKIGDGYQGWSEKAPFDKIIVTCSPENIPEPLIEQLKEGGRMIIPLGERYQQRYYLLRKVDGKLEADRLSATLFVPMTGEAEEKRELKPDPSRPTSQNGGFEELLDGVDPPQLRGWHYHRQTRQVVATGDDPAPEGSAYAVFTNETSGRSSHILQGFAIDGREVSWLKVSLWVRTEGIHRGETSDQVPGIGIMFFDREREILGEKFIGPWGITVPDPGIGGFRTGSGRSQDSTDSEWRRIEVTIAVPKDSMEAMLRVGLFGATGTLSIDGLQYEATTPERARRR